MLAKEKYNNGITLIALVITIVILLILAGIAIAALTGKNGLFQRARQAQENTNVEQIIEELKLKVMDVQTQKEGKATLKDFVEYLDKDEEETYIISLTKTASIQGDIPDLNNVKEIYVTYKNVECKIDEFLRVEYSTTISSSREESPTLSGCSRYIHVNVKRGSKKFYLSVDIPETDKIEKIQYYIDNKKIYEGTEKSCVAEGLEPGKEYTIYAIVTYVNEKISQKVIAQQYPEADIYVTKFGNDTTGDGTVDKPFATVKKAIESAINGQKIYIDEGTYQLESMYGQTGDGELGIWDNGKQIEIFGNNDKTILEFDATKTTLRDGSAISLENEKSVIRNLTYVFKPKKGSTYQRAIFRRSKGKTENVFFRIVGTNSASYLYYNGQPNPNNVINCTFFHDRKSVDYNYSGNCNFKNIATNVDTRGTNTNVIVKDFGTEQDTIQELIQKSKENSDFNSNQVGVFYGENAWKD